MFASRRLESLHTACDNFPPVRQRRCHDVANQYGHGNPKTFQVDNYQSPSLDTTVHPIDVDVKKVHCSGVQVGGDDQAPLVDFLPE
ncbi:hypothetical protein CVT26_011807 [Gymnopilus dilepis]|uniref:Uncharacterized protein n=1 Tax=Gymnopilus dilepis TaxID=231916 RepID=A0A409WCC5_9AGAR|nr:hypothetical protein CVT26_011807 [Gymnopilus dilepis]